MKRTIPLVFSAALALPAIALTGCDRDEEILDVETRQGEVEVERDTGTGALEVEN